MKANMTVRLGLAIVSVLLAGTALAQGPGGGQEMGEGGGPGFGMHRPPMERAFGAEGEMGRWWNNPRIVEQLKLTDDQRKAMDGILLEHREKLVDLRGSLEKAELEMEPLMRDDQPNEAKILAQIDKVAQARAELEKANARFLLAIRAKLTPEQWKQVQDFRKNGGMRGMEHRGMGAGGEGRGEGRGQGQGGWKQGGQGPGGQFHRQMLPPPFPPDAAPQAPPAPPAPGTGAEQ
jgi:Spy/CpxP family protein refolding chaperone